MTWSRRSFLRASLLGSGGLVTGGLDAALAAIPRGAKQLAEGFGPLVRDPAGLLDLPAGFQYRMFSPGASDEDSGGQARFKSTLTDGTLTPCLHDGMAAFPGSDGGTILVRNHELSVHHKPIVDPERKRPYDVLVGGGTTTLWVDRNRNLVKSFASLSGTLRNCAGGRTPWGSWFTAEEAVQIPGERDARNADRTPRVKQRHGYVFEVDSASDGLVAPVPLKALGRFRHEAVAVDPVTGFAYLTEDRDDALLYRFRPTVLIEGAAPSSLRAGDYALGGVLEALRVRTRPQLETSNRVRGSGMRLGESLDVDWVRIENPDPEMDMERGVAGVGERTAPSSTRAQGFAAGCARFAQTEGIEYANDCVYLCCTSGGSRTLGQVFRIHLREQKLTLLVEPDHDAQLSGPDNLCLAPWGDLLVCEDNKFDRTNFVVGVTPAGTFYRIARNAHPNESEFAGACFSPDAQTLFVNVQSPGMTFAIWGPWSARRG